MEITVCLHIKNSSAKRRKDMAIYTKFFTGNQHVTYLQNYSSLLSTHVDKYILLLIFNRLKCI